jgi:hypothetical protein
MNRNTQHGWTAGKKSLLYLGIGAGVLTLSRVLMISGGSLSFGALLGGILLLVGLPLAVMAFIFGSLSVMENDGRKQGIFTICCFLIMIAVANILPFP